MALSTETPSGRLRQPILYADQLWRQQRFFAGFLVAVGLVMTILLIYQGQIAKSANLIWLLYIPSGLLLGGAFLLYKRRSYVEAVARRVKGPLAQQLDLSQPTEAPRERSYFDRWDLIALLALTAVAFVLRFFSPIMPDFFVHPFQGPAITDCVPNTPINPQGDPGTLCGLPYPFNRGYPDQNKVLSPPNGQVFDEIYFPVDAQIDFKNTL